MPRSCDLAVIGTGAAAAGVALRVRAAGWSVAVIDGRPYGGTCALRGCDPKKVLVGATAAVDQLRRLRDHALSGDVSVDWHRLMHFKRGFTDPVPAKREQQYAEKGIETLHGCARFVGPNTLRVGEERLQARHIVIAVGAEPVKLGLPGEELLITSEQFLALPQLPPRMVLVGGGYVAAEFSMIAAIAGCRVTVLQRAERMLTRFDPDLVGWLMERFGALGIDVRTGTTVTAIEQTAAALRVQATAASAAEAFEADAVVHAAGRAPPLAALDLEAAGVAVDQGRLQLNDYLQSVSNPAVYAAGDAAQAGPPLTPVAGHDAGVVAANLLKGNHRKPDYRGVPSVAFTQPPIATVGLSEAAARKQGLHFRVHSRKTPDWFTARQSAEPVYGFKILIAEDTDRVLGAHLVGPHADEVINLFALAIRHDLPAAGLKHTLFAYPTAASDLAYML